MNFSLLAPAALGLLLLGLGPVLAHLARQRPVRTQPFGAMLLLQRLARKQKRRRRIRDPLLLLLRILAILLAVLGVTRPELRWPAPPPAVGGSGAVVVVIDDSLSMDLAQGGLAGALPGGSTLFSTGRQQAADLLRSLPEGTLVGAVTVGGQARRLSPQLSADRAAVATAVEELSQGQGATDLVGALREARRLLAGQGGEVVIFTDEAGPTAVPAAAEEMALLSSQGGALVPRPLRAPAPANLAVVDARYGDGPEGGSVHLRVANFGPEDVEAPVTVSLPDGAEITAFVEVPAGGSAEEAVTVPRVAAGGVGVATVRDSALAADDSFAFHLPRVGASRVLVIDGDPGPTAIQSEVYFLERALAPWGSSAAARGGLLPEVKSPQGLQTLDPEQHRVVFLANVGDPLPMAGRLVDFVRAGGGLVVTLGNNVTAERYNGALDAVLPARLRKLRALGQGDQPGAPVMLPDTSLPLFEPFARGGRSAFGLARVQQVFTTDPYTESEELRTLLALEGGVPLLIERRVGKGRLLLLTTTIDLSWTDLPLQSVFMPLIQRIVSYLGGEAGGGGERLSVRVGETVTVLLPETVLDVQITGPRGPVAGRVRSGAVSFEAERAGAYLVETPGAPPLAWVAANVDPAESDVRPGPSLVETAARVDPERYLKKVSLAPWLLGLALALGLIQAAFSGPRADPELAADQHTADQDDPSPEPAEARHEI